jgi:hypothetical protein
MADGSATLSSIQQHVPSSSNNGLGDSQHMPLQSMMQHGACKPACTPGLLRYPQDYAACFGWCCKMHASALTSGLRSALGAAHSLLRLLPTAFVRRWPLQGVRQKNSE